jgi:hypothetical protein
MLAPPWLRLAALIFELQALDAWGQTYRKIRLCPALG